MRHWAKAFGFLGSLAVLSAAPSAPAESKKPTKEAAKPAAATEAPTTKETIKLVPEGMRWGMSRGELEKLIDKFVDDDFRPRYKDAGKSASRIKDLDAESANLKAAFRRSWNDLPVGPTGLDSHPIAPEFSKGNGEAVMSHHRGPGVKIWFFFIGGRLWKTYEEISFVKGGLYGDTMEAAAKKLIEGVGGTAPRATPANPDKGQFYDVLDWNDKETHMRIWDRSGVLVIVREEKGTALNIGSMRKNSGQSAAAMDPQVAAILRGSDAPPPPPDKGKTPAKKLGRVA